MAKKSSNAGFHSAAGLIRYFDAEEKSSLKIPPWLVVAMSIATMVLVTAAHLIYKL
ncbi:MAG: preprotein translocase subunit Sec61beta [Thermoplasmata archaeon]|nr:MAG: preprotein translocase subunit Sec61beta [Thermoplasmata archaeon]